MNKTVSIISAAAFAVIAPLAASASVIDFEGFDNGANVTSVTSTDGLVSATVSASARLGNGSFIRSTARAFDSELNSTFDPDLEAPFTTGGLSLNPGNVLIIQEPGSAIPDDNATGGFIDFIFGSSVLFSGFTGLDDANFRVTANGDTIEVGSFRVPNDNGFGVFSLASAVEVDSLRFRFQGASGAIDDLTFIAPDIAPVPVPAALPLLLAGIGGLAVMKRRQKKASKA